MSEAAHKLCRKQKNMGFTAYFTDYLRALDAKMSSQNRKTFLWTSVLFLTKYYFSNHIKNDIGRARCTYGREEISYRVFVRKPEK
jgi:hypothetical protein